MQQKYYRYYIITVANFWYNYKDDTKNRWYHYNIIHYCYLNVSQKMLADDCNVCFRVVKIEHFEVERVDRGYRIKVENDVSTQSIA